MQKEMASLGLTVDKATRPQSLRTCINFVELPDDVLFAVIQKCDIKTLGRLCRVCQKLNTLIQFDSVWSMKRDLYTLVGSSVAESNSCTKSKRKTDIPCLKEQFRLSFNWVEKKYKERVLCRLNPRQLPWIQYAGDTLWFSTRNTIKCYRIQKNGRIREDSKHHMKLRHVGHQQQSRFGHSGEEYQRYSNLMNEDVSRFVVKDNMAVSGCRDGSLYVFDCENGKCIDSMYKIHKTDTQTVDFHGNCIISGSRDKTVKILSMSDENLDNSPVRTTVDMHDRIWSVSMAPDGQCFSVGTSGCKGNPSLSVWDVERAELLFSLGSYRYGAGVLDMKYEDNNTLLTCGHDANLRMWDLRSGQCVDERQEPYDTTLYCLQTDRNFTMVTGTARYGMIRLWDKRKTESVQEYFLSQKSPVYSLAFDSSRLYAALDLSINIMDFTVYPS